METLRHLLENNRRWAAAIKASDPEFFHALSQQHAPEYLWIGCSDARVPANEIVGLSPGELFVHRNVANLVVHTDFNVLSVLQYAVEVLRVRHIIVCGHYGCGGVRAAIEAAPLGLIDNWLRHIREVCERHQGEIASLEGGSRRVDRLCELNVEAQVRNVAHTTIVQDAWRRGQALTVHGWIYSIADGILHDLHATIDEPGEISPAFRVGR